MLKTTRTILALGLSAIIITAAGCSRHSETSDQTIMPEGTASFATNAKSNYDTGAGMTEDAIMPETSPMPPQTSPAMPEAGNDSIAATASDRKVITNISYSIQTITYDDSRKQLDALIAETGSFVQSSGTGGSVDGGDAYSNLTIRVPADKLDHFKEAVETIGNVISRNEAGRDATAEFYDSEARIKVLNAQESRVLELLDRAETIEDIMLIENELTRIRTEIERLTTTVNRINDLTEYATVNINLDQTEVLTPVKTSFWDKVSTLFTDSFKGFVRVLGGIGAAIVWLLPYIVIGGIIVIVVVRFARKRKKPVAAAATTATAPEQEDNTKQ